MANNLQLRRNARVKNKRSSNSRKDSSAYVKGIRNIEVIYGNLISEFKNMSLYQQVMSCYFIFLVVFVTIIIFFKFQNTTYNLDMQTNVNYYSSVVLDLLNKEKDLKMELDMLNNNDYIGQFYTHLFFYRIYSKELTSHNFADLVYDESREDTPFARDSLDGNLNTIYTGLSNSDNNLDFSLRRLDLRSEILRANEANNDQMSLSFFLPIVYTFTPLFYQNMKMNGVKVLNYYFLGYSYNDGCDNLTENMYFKYPIEQHEISPTLTNKNIFDSTMDPIGVCYLKDIKNLNATKVMNTNWYYNYESKLINNKTKISDSRLITLLKLGLNYERAEYYVNYQTIKMQAASGKFFYFTIAQKIDRLNSNLPFLSTQSTGEKPYDYFSIINFNSEADDHSHIQINESDNVFLKDYNIDDNNDLVHNIPKFIEHIYKYTMLPKKYIDQRSGSISNINSLMLTISEIKTIWEDYDVNYYFSSDSNLFNIIVFMNNLMKYKHYEANLIQQYEIINATTTNRTLTESFNTEQFHRCSISNLTDWYEYVYSPSETSSYDCLNDYCFFNKCTTDNKYYKNPSSLRYLPNCYCLPMYCQDKFTNSTPEAFKNINESLFYDASNNNTNLDYIYNKEKGTLQCRLSFYQKQQDISPFNFKAVMNFNNLGFNSDTTMFVMYLMEETPTDYQVINSLIDGVSFVKVLIFAIYSVFMFFILIAFIKCMGIKLGSLKDRIDKVKLIIKMILKISEHGDFSNDTDAEGNHNAPRDNFNINEINELGPSEDDYEEEKLHEEINFADKDNHKDDFITSVKPNDEDNEQSVKYSDDNYDINNLQLKEENMLNKVDAELRSLGIRGRSDDDSTQHHERYSDELQQLIFIVVDNLSEFKIEFNINTNMYEVEDKLNRQFIDIIRSKYYENQIMPKDKKKRINPLSSDSFSNQNSMNLLSNNNYVSNTRSENESVESDASWEDLESNLSLNIIYEILSTEEMVDLSQVRSNFCFKEPGEESIFNFYECIETILYDESNYTNELTDPDKLKTAINYFLYEIHMKWRELYLKRKSNDDI